MTLKNTLTAAVLASGLAFGTVPAALAQAEPDGAALVQEEGKLDSFVVAALAVDEVRNTYMAQLQTLEDEAEQQSLIQEANAAMVQAIEESEGITLEEYVAIGEAASTDPEIAAMLDTMMREMAPAP
jgi:RNA processing factor Prp31